MELCEKAIRNWMLAEKLKLNDYKMEFLIIGTRQQVGESQSQTIYLLVTLK